MFRLGILLILLSFFPWIALPAVPWWIEGSSAQAKALGLLILMGELLFWPGLALAGKETWSAVKAKGWRAVLPELIKKLRAGR